MFTYQNFFTITMLPRSTALPRLSTFLLGLQERLDCMRTHKSESHGTTISALLQHHRNVFATIAICTGKQHVYASRLFRQLRCHAQPLSLYGSRRWSSYTRADESGPCEYNPSAATLLPAPVSFVLIDEKNRNFAQVSKRAVVTVPQVEM
jgi:hypothetical protein